MDIDLYEDALDEATLPINTRQLQRETQRDKVRKHDEIHSPAKPKPDWRTRQARKQRRSKQREFFCGLRVLQELDRQAIPTQYDASLITNHIATQKWSETPTIPSLKEFYGQLAATVLRDNGLDGIHRVKVALTFACCSEWLERSGDEENGWSYFIPALTPNTYGTGLAAAA